MLFNPFVKLSDRIRAMAEKRLAEAQLERDIKKFMEEIDQRAAKPETPEPPSALSVKPLEKPNDPRLEDMPRFYASLNLEVEQRSDGKWACRARDYNAYCVKEDPELAILTACRWIMKSGVLTMPALPDTAPATNEGDDETDEGTTPGTAS